MNKPLTRERAGSWSWIFQAFSGAMLLILLGLHMVAQHFIVKGGLRTYADVVTYISNPIIFVLEILFLIAVTWYALLGVRAILFDLGLKPVTERRVTVILTVIGMAAVGLRQ